MFLVFQWQGRCLPLSFFLFNIGNISITLLISNKKKKNNNKQQYSPVQDSTNSGIMICWKVLQFVESRVTHA